MTSSWRLLYPLNFASQRTRSTLYTCVYILILLTTTVDLGAGQSRHYPMREPFCNNFYRNVPAAVIDGAEDSRLGPNVCDITLSTPGKGTIWMFKVERAVIFNPYVTIMVFDGHMTGDKPILTFTSTRKDPGVVLINSTTMTIRLRHNNASNFSFKIVVTARIVRSRPDVTCNGFKCESGACIARSLMCDGVDNCFDFSDETNNATAYCEHTWPLKGENWGVLASMLGAGAVLGVTAACCRHIRKRRRSSLDDLYDLNEGPYVHKYAYRYAIIRPPKKPNKTNVVLGRDGHMHYNATNV